MTLRDASGSFVLDFSELTNEVYQTVLRYEDKGDRRLQVESSDMIYMMIDDYITTQLLWARPRRPTADARDYTAWERYGERRRRPVTYNVNAYRGKDIYKEFRDLLSKIPGRIKSDLVERVSDKVADQVLDHLDLPSWRIVHLTRNRNQVLIEVGEDFRIEEWEKEHGHEFGF